VLRAFLYSNGSMKTIAPLAEIVTRLPSIRLARWLATPICPEAPALTMHSSMQTEL